MVSDVDPATAARMAAGDVEGDPDDLGGDPAADRADHGADPAAPAGDQGGGWMDALLQTDPDTPLERVESPWRPDVGGAARIYRSVQKMTGMDGMPAGLDLVLGIAEMVAAAGDDRADDPGGEEIDSDTVAVVPSE